MYICTVYAYKSQNVKSLWSCGDTLLADEDHMRPMGRLLDTPVLDGRLYVLA